MMFIACQALIFSIFANEGLGCSLVLEPLDPDFSPNAIDLQMDIAAGNIASGAVSAGLNYVPEFGLFGRSLPKREVKPFATYYFPFLKVFIISKMLSFL